MLRIILTYLIPLIAPFVIYSLFVRITGRRNTEEALKTPWFWLVASGLILVVITLFAVALTTGSDPTGTYVPPRLEDGRIVPSQVK
jgi:hypothetical protein